MKHLPAWNNLNKILSLCKKNRFCTVKKTGNEISGIKYGALGSQLKRNILNQWSSSVISNSDVNIFPVESDKPPNSAPATETFQQNKELFEDIMHHYADTLPLIGENLEFGLALSKTVNGRRHGKDMNVITSGEEQPQAAVDTVSDSHAVCWNLAESTSLVVAFFCPPMKTTEWFHYWQGLRYNWWRKLASVPSRFSISNISQTNCGDNFTTLQCEFPWGQDTLERVSASSLPKVDSLDETSKCGIDGKKSVSPCVITCEADLDLAVIAYLSDAYEEKQWSGDLRPVLKLHHMLAPYKVSIVINGSTAASIKKLHNLAAFQVKELKENAISILPNPQLATEVPLETQFRRLDEMGVPYTIVLSDNSLNGGTAGLRRRDTSTQQDVHVCELTSRLLQYLEMNSKIS